VIRGAWTDGEKKVVGPIRGHRVYLVATTTGTEANSFSRYVRKDKLDSDFFAAGLV
jgi:hypothetical protein